MFTVPEMTPDSARIEPKKEAGTLRILKHAQAHSTYPRSPRQNASPRYSHCKYTALLRLGFEAIFQRQILENVSTTR
jgi:hypothetical protein